MPEELERFFDRADTQIGNFKRMALVKLYGAGPDQRLLCQIFLSIVSGSAGY